MGTWFSTPQIQSPGHHNKPFVRMCSSGTHFPNFADIGDTVILFVDFGQDCKPVTRENLDQALNGANPPIEEWKSPTQHHLDDEEEQPYEIMLAGFPTFLRKIRPKDENGTSFRAQAKLLMPGNVLEDPGGLVKFVVPYCSNSGEYGVITEKDDDQYDANHRVRHHALWNQLIVHNEEIREEIRQRTSRSVEMTSYGDVRQRQPGRQESAAPSDHAENSAVTSTSVEVLTPLDKHIPAPKIHPAERYWPDTWEMKCWRPCCDPIMRPRNCFTRFLSMFLVAPLTNVTGLSLYYQMYLLEIFHLRFLTKNGHYICMPFIVMMMLNFFAQWRFIGCYMQGNIEVFVLNGAAVLAIILTLWYIVWGLIQKTFLLGFFMIMPMTILYALANITFQLAVKNSSPHTVNCTSCWDFTYQTSDHAKFFNAFKLMHWYYNPVLWAFLLSFCQAFSHVFEPKIPPRVDGTQHWMSCSDMLKKYGDAKTIMILMAQSVFGTIDEFLASPRLLPLLILRIAFTIGYSAKEWKVLNILVQKSLEYGDPAIDYIGTGGAEYLPESSIIPVASLSDTDIHSEKLDAYSNRGYNIGKLKRNLEEMGYLLTERHYKMLANPRTLRHGADKWLKQFIIVRHYVAKYELQVHAYGPFRTQKQDLEVQHDNERLERDFPGKKHKAFQNFLKEVRFHLWMMEDDMITNRHRGFSPYCRKEM